jgi:hypothetical protein
MLRAVRARKRVFRMMAISKGIIRLAVMVEKKKIKYCFE